MKKILFLASIILLSLALSGCGQKTSALGNSAVDAGETENRANAADKLEVYYFHRTARCYSCNTAGEYIAKTISEFFPYQTKNGLIDYREINIDLPENREVARKFQASGSSLFINRIMDGQDNIENDTDIWRLLGDEVRFKSYLANKINSYLGI